MLKLSSLKIDPEFSAQILPLSFEELQQLEMNMIRHRPDHCVEQNHSGRA